MDVLKILRERDGYSQEELAKHLRISRPTIIKYERDCACIPVDTIKQLAEMFDVPASAFIDGKIPAALSYNILPAKATQDIKTDLRIDIPQESVSKFKEVLLYILGKVGAKPNVGQTVIYKLLYFIDFDYYEAYGKHLVGANYIKNTYGPTPVDFAKIVKQMIEDNELEEISTKHFKYDQKKYLPLRTANTNILSDNELTHIDMVLRKHSDKSAADLSAFSHKDVPWITTEEGQSIPYEAVFHRTAETKVT